jgi:broad specificity phosphatase PhoE
VTPTLILWRHGHTAWNGENRVQGHSDSELSATGHDQAAAAAPGLAARKPARILSSDLRRATDTAAALAQLTGQPVDRDPRLRERRYGDWEGLTMAEIAERFPAAYARRTSQQDIGHGVEAPADVMKRMGEVLREAAEATPGGTTVVVTHGGAARYGMFELLGWPAERLGSVAALTNCHYTELRLDPTRGWMLYAHNVPPITGLTGGAPGYE